MLGAPYLGRVSVGTAQNFGAIPSFRMTGAKFNQVASIFSFGVGGPLTVRIRLAQSDVLSDVPGGSA